MILDMDWEQTRQAWDLVCQTRFCPPDEIIFNQPRGGEAEAHLKACPICRERTTLDDSAAARPQLFKALERRTGPNPENSEAAPGQIRSLHPSLAAWGPKDRYYNPPVVLILDASRNLPNGVLVAQCYHDLSFMDQEDDVWLGQARFAEPWNIYTIHRKHLGPVHGMIDGELLQKVREAAQTTSPELPVWSLKFVFRQMEIELGCFFSAGSMLALMEEYDRSARAPQQPAGASAEPWRQTPGPVLLNWEKQSAHELSRQLREMGLKVPSGSQTAKPADLYFLSEPGDQKMNRAAAGEDVERQVPVLAFRVNQGRPVSLELLSACLTDVVRSPQIILGGRLNSRLDKDEQWQAVFRWRGRDGKLLESSAGHLIWRESEPAYFWAVFPFDGTGVSHIEKKLCVRLFSLKG